MEMYCRASNTEHVMRRDDRVPRTACAPATHWPGQVNGMRDEDEDEQSRKKKKKKRKKAALSTSLRPLLALTAWLIYKLWPFSPSFHCH